MTGVAVITGGGRGIGRATAVRLSRDGWSVAIAGRNPESLASAAAEIGGDTLTVPTDVGSPEEVDALFAAVVERFGRIDLLFNNAGIGAPAIPIDELDVQAWLDVVNINLTGSFLCARAAFSQMRRQDPQGGRIINNGSISAETPRPFSAPYTATKHAITGLTKSLSLDGRDISVVCSQIDLGNISSDMGDKMAAGVPQADGSNRVEPVISVDYAADAVAMMAALPLEANVLRMTLMANGMPLVGRG